MNKFCILLGFMMGVLEAESSVLAMPTLDDYKNPALDPSLGWEWDNGNWWATKAPIQNPADGQNTRVNGLNLINDMTRIFDASSKADGWELYTRRLTKTDGLPSGPQAIGSDGDKIIDARYPGSTPFFVLYNRYQSKLRFFVYTGNVAPPEGLKEFDFVVGILKFPFGPMGVGVPSESQYDESTKLFQLYPDKITDPPPYKLVTTIQGALGGMGWMVFEVPVAYDPSVLGKGVQLSVIPFALTSQKITAKGDITIGTGSGEVGYVTAGLTGLKTFSNYKAGFTSAVGFANSVSGFLSRQVTKQIGNPEEPSVKAMYKNLGLKDNEISGITNIQSLSSFIGGLASAGKPLAPFVGAVGAGVSLFGAFSNSGVPQYTKGTFTLEGNLEGVINFVPPSIGISGASINPYGGAEIPVFAKTHPNELLGSFGVVRRPKAVLNVILPRRIESCQLIAGNACPTPSQMKVDALLFVENPKYWMIENPSVPYQRTVSTISSADGVLLGKNLIEPMGGGNGISKINISVLVNLNTVRTIDFSVMPPTVYWKYFPSVPVSSFLMNYARTIYWQGANGEQSYTIPKQLDVDIVKVVYRFSEDNLSEERIENESSELLGIKKLSFNSAIQLLLD